MSFAIGVFQVSGMGLVSSFESRFVATESELANHFSATQFATSGLSDQRASSARSGSLRGLLVLSMR